MEFRGDLPQMDGKLWSRLPEDVMERILAFLPVSASLRFRSVCKPWNSLLPTLRSPVGLEEDSSRPLLCLIACGTGPPIIHVLNIESLKWNELSLRFLPSEMVDRSVIASGGGLLYMQTRVGDDIIYLTCNPLTGAWKQLFVERRDACDSAPMPMLTCISAPLISCPTKGGYKIVEAGHGGFTDPCTKIFDSSTRLWSSGGNLPSDVTGFDSEAVIVGLCLYVVTSLPSKFLQMKIETSGGGAWTESAAGIPPSAVNPHLVGVMDTLVMVAAVDSCWREGDIPQPFGIRVWTLDETLRKWRETSVLPQDMYDLFLSRNLGTFDSLHCAAQGTRLFIANFDGSFLFSYDLVQDSWNMIPECDALPSGKFCIERMFVFEPTFSPAL